jgi:hypothetical protein
VEERIVERPEAEAKGNARPIVGRAIVPSVKRIVVEERVVVKRQGAPVRKRIAVETGEVPRVPLRTVPLGIAIISVVLVVVVIVVYLHVLSSRAAFYTLLVRVRGPQLRVTAGQPHRQGQKDDR